MECWTPYSFDQAKCPLAEAQQNTTNHNKRTNEQGQCLQSNLGNDAAVNRPSQVHSHINPLNISSGSHSKKYILKYDQCSLSQFVFEDESFSLHEYITSTSLSSICINTAIIQMASSQCSSVHWSWSQCIRIQRTVIRYGNVLNLRSANDSKSSSNFHSIYTSIHCIFFFSFILFDPPPQYALR